MTVTLRTWEQPVVRTIERKSSKKIVNSGIWVVNLDTHDREGLPRDEGREGRAKKGTGVSLKKGRPRKDKKQNVPQSNGLREFGYLKSSARQLPLLELSC